MTISRMAAGDQDAVYALLECFKDKLGSRVGTPVTEKAYEFGFKTPVTHSYHPCICSLF